VCHAKRRSYRIEARTFGTRYWPNVQESVNAIDGSKRDLRRLLLRRNVQARIA
jgi:hypothetical protein